MISSQLMRWVSAWPSRSSSTNSIPSPARFLSTALAHRRLMPEGALNDLLELRLLARRDRIEAALEVIEQRRIHDRTVLDHLRQPLAKFTLAERAERLDVRHYHPRFVKCTD